MRADLFYWHGLYFCLYILRYHGNFNKYPFSQVSIEDVEYDYESVMHYGYVNIPGMSHTLINYLFIDQPVLLMVTEHPSILIFHISRM